MTPSRDASPLRLADLKLIAPWKEAAMAEGAFFACGLRALAQGGTTTRNSKKTLAVVDADEWRVVDNDEGTDGERLDCDGTMRRK